MRVFPKLLNVAVTGPRAAVKKTPRVTVGRGPVPRQRSRRSSDCGGQAPALRVRSGFRVDRAFAGAWPPRYGSCGVRSSSVGQDRQILPCSGSGDPELQTGVREGLRVTGPALWVRSGFCVGRGFAGACPPRYGCGGVFA